MSQMRLFLKIADKGNAKDKYEMFMAGTLLDRVQASCGRSALVQRCEAVWKSKLLGAMAEMMGVLYLYVSQLGGKCYVVLYALSP
jgi:hypothetical protein